MKSLGSFFRHFLFVLILSSIVVCSLTPLVLADVYLSILAVNGTNEEKEKDIEEYLPAELKLNDILDTAGLELDYDVNRRAYYVHGKVVLAPKESKAIKIRIRDVWKIEKTEVQNIKDQIGTSFDRIQNSEYEEVGAIKKDALLKRLDYITKKQDEFADNVGKRIDTFRIYSDELKEIRDNSVSVKYWKTRAPSATETKIYTFVIEVENPDEKKKKTVEPKHYLPSEIKPEHIVDTQGFDIRYDGEKRQSFLTKKEELEPGEKKKYNIDVVDIWNVGENEIEDLRDRTKAAFKALETTEFAESASYLVKSIYTKLDLIDETQEVERGITEHISIYRDNSKRFDLAEKDVRALEELLEALREKLEESVLKNVLQKIQSFKSVADIAEAIFGTKPSINTTWKIIAGVVIFVGLLTMVHFVIWGKRSREAKLKKEDEEGEEEKGDET